MKDYITLGPTPCGEDCAQLGAPDYYERYKKEIIAYKHQLTRQFGTPPLGCSFKLKGFPHDFGTYHELVVIFDDECEDETAFAFKVEGNLPENWDEEAKKELALIQPHSL